MMRAVLAIVTLTVWAGVMFGAAHVLTPDEEATIMIDAEAELAATVKNASAAATALIQQQLAETREAAQVLRPGLLLERLEPPPPLPEGTKPKRPKKGAPAAELP